MANQYHDELGRFCSRNEMGEAVDRLFEALRNAPTGAEADQASEQWFSLKSEYEAILAKPEPAEEKLEAFLKGEPTRKEVNDWDRAQMLLLLDKREGREARDQMRKLLDETDFSDLPPARAAELFGSTKLSLEEKYEIASRTKNGLAMLLKVEPGYVADGGEHEQQLLTQISAESKYNTNEAWVILAQRSVLVETRRKIIDAARDERYYGGLTLPAVELGKNPSLTKEEAVELLEVVAAHHPSEYEKAQKNLREGGLNLGRARNGYADRGNSDRAKFQTWRLNGFELEEQKAELAAFHAKIAEELPKSQWQNPTALTVLSLDEGTRFKALQARVDANTYGDLDAKYTALGKRVRSRAFKKELYSAREEAKAELRELDQRQRAALDYRYSNEEAARLRAAISQKA